MSKQKSVVPSGNFYIEFLAKKRRNVQKKLNQIQKLEKLTPQKLDDGQRKKISQKPLIQTQLEELNKIERYYNEAWAKKKHGDQAPE